MKAMLLLGWSAWVVAGRLRIGSPWMVSAAAAALVVSPIVAAAVVAVDVARRKWRAAASSRARRGADEETALVFADLVTLALTAGMSLRSAVEEAASHLDGEVGDAAASLAAEMDRVGVAAALGTVDGILAGFGRMAAGAAASGAPLAASVGAFAATRRRETHAARAAAMRRLPIRLLLPLALLILPGFVVLAVGPALLQALARLGQ